MSYILIPIFSDPFLHPLHKDNDLSLLYLRHWGDREGRMICIIKQTVKVYILGM